MVLRVRDLLDLEVYVFNDYVSDKSFAAWNTL